MRTPNHCGDKTVAWPYPSLIRHACLLSFTLIGICFVYQMCLGQPTTTVTSWKQMAVENGSIEQTQVVLLIAAVVAGIVATRLERESIWRTILINATLLSSVIVLREVPSSHWVWLGWSESSFRIFKRVGIACALLAILCRSVHAFVRFPKDRAAWFQWSFIWPAVPFFMTLALSQACEELGWMFCEEAIELLVYAMIACTLGWRLKRNLAVGALSVKTQRGHHAAIDFCR